MRIPAKFASFCGACSHPIMVGDQIEWSPGTKPVHVQCPAPAQKPVVTGEVTKPRFVIAIEKAVHRETVRAGMTSARASARDHFVRVVCSAGQRPTQLEVPPGEEIVLTLGPRLRVVERAVVRAGVDVYYLRYNGDTLSDHMVNNVKPTAEIGWCARWSPVVQMAVEGIRIRSTDGG